MDPYLELWIGAASEVWVVHRCLGQAMAIVELAARTVDQLCLVNGRTRLGWEKGN